MSTLKSKLESLLFIANKPMTSRELADFLEVQPAEAEAGLDELLADYTNNSSGLQLIKNNSKYQLVSAADNSKIVQDFLHDETSGELSRPSLEALTIIAYRGPVSKIDLDRLRGVNCALILRNLLMRGLIEEKFDKDKNEIYYNITLDFIRYLGVNRVEDLPDYARLHAEETIDKMLNREELEVPAENLN